MSSTPALPDIGSIVFISTKPLIKFFLPAGCGFWLAKRQLFPLAAARGSGQLILNVLLPALLFNKVVQSIDNDNVGALGPIVLVGAFYELLGLALAWLVRLLLPVPSNFRNGLLVAGMIGNWGDLPFAVLQTVTAAAPFNPSTDPALAQAYASVFMVICMITTFPLGGIALLARDYKEPFTGKDTRPPLAAFLSRTLRRHWKGTSAAEVSSAQSKDQGKADNPIAPGLPAKERFLEDEVTPMASSSALPLPNTSRSKPGFEPLTQQVSNRSSTSVIMQEAGNAGAAPYSLIGRKTPAPAIEEMPDEPTRPNTRPGSMYQFVHELPAVIHIPRFKLSRFPGKVAKFARSLREPVLDFFRNLITPPTIALAVALLCALVRPLKALFVHIPGYSFHQAPDGQPVLDVLFQVTTFLGGAAVPTSLIILGASLARIKVPRPVTSLPLRAICGLTIAKLVILPVAGVTLVQGLTYHTSLIPPENHVLRYSILILSCVPSATNQIVLTTIVAPPDQATNADLFGCFLLAQYAVLFVAFTVVAGFSLSLIF